MKAHPADCPGWIYETHEDGARIVKDRCMTCNEPPWYPAMRRRAASEKFFNWFGPLMALVFFFGLLGMLIYSDWYCRSGRCDRDLVAYRMEQMRDHQ